MALSLRVCRLIKYSIHVLCYLLHVYPVRYPAPSGFPQDVAVSVVTSQSVELSWGPPPPEERNGIITGYVTTLVRRDTGSQYQLTSPTTTITFTTLTPFTSYTVTVAASTAIGLGPQSTQLNFITDEDGISIYFTIMAYLSLHLQYLFFD